MDQIKKILKDNYTDGVFHTHVSMVQPKGKFQLNRELHEDFWNHYCDAVENNDDPTLGLAQKPQGYAPVLADIDLKIRDDDFEEETLYTDKQLETVVEIYQSVIRNIVDECTERDLMCVVLEKELYSETKNEITFLKNGFHLHFPYCFLSKVDQEVHLLPRVKEQLNDLNLFHRLGIKESGSVVDNVLSKNWLMYKSKKSENKKPYIVTRIYDSGMNKISLEKAFKYYEIYDQKERRINIRGNVKYYLPRILSIIPHGRSTKILKRGLVSPLKETIRKREKKSSTSHRKLTVDQALAVAKRLLPMLANFRADDRNEWMTIGWILYNISDGDSEGMELWCEFSERCEEKYDENACIYQWERMTKTDLSLGTLRYYASVDNPEEYKKFKEEQQKKHIRNSIDGSHNDIAKALHAEYGDQFVCASICNKIWFQFTNHGWEQIEEGVYLREKISGTFVNKYIELGKSIYDEMRDSDDKNKQALLNAKLKTLNKLIQNLKSAPYKNNVLKECVCKGTLISCSDGISRRIENMHKYQQVLAWDESNNGITHSEQVDYIPKGEKDCLKITMIDGTELTITPDHKILRNNKWVEARSLVRGNTLHMGLQYPTRKYTKPVTPWILNMGNYTFTNNTEEEYSRSLAFSRLLGYLLTDGSISGIKACATFPLKMDAKIFVKDIELITGCIPSISTILPNGSYRKSIQYSVFLPNKLTREIVALPGVPNGRRVAQSESIPDFLFAPNCPLGIVNEFLAGLWGGDGHSPCLNKNQNTFVSTKISKTKLVKYEDELLSTMNKVKMLLKLSGIQNVTINHGKYFSCGKRGERCVEKRLNIGMDNYLKFFECIGVRYCTEKSVRFNLVASYRKYRDLIEYQYNSVVQRLKKLVNYVPGKRNGIKGKLDQAFDEICKEQEILYPELVRPKYSTITRQIKTGVFGHKFQNSAKPVEFLREINALHIFEKRYCIAQDHEFIPTFPMKIAGICHAGKKEVYDITVNNHHSFIANGLVVHNCMEVFYDPRFRDKLDTNPNLIRFQNGVYDFILNIFRPGRPEDFLSQQLPIHYRNFTEDDEKVCEVHTFLEQIFPDKSLRKYFMDIFCHIFVGGNHEKIIVFWTGDGDNGKSVMQNFFEKMLGKLSIKMNTNIFTGKKPSAGAAFADLARAGGGVRLTTLEEPNNDEQINVGIVKNLTGSDTFYARDLFEKGKDGREITPMFKVVFVCNRLPRVKHADPAFWNRARVIPFESTFCKASDPAPETYEEQLRQKRFPRDKNFAKKIPGMVEALAWVLINHRLTVKTPVEPPKVLAATDIYRKQNDIYRQFTEESIIADPNKFMSLTELYTLFKEWYKDSLPGNTLPVKNEVEEYFLKIWGPTERGKKWKGYRMRTLKDDVDQGEAIILTEDDLVDYNKEKQLEEEEKKQEEKYKRKSSKKKKSR